MKHKEESTRADRVGQVQITFTNKQPALIFLNNAVFSTAANSVTMWATVKKWSKGSDGPPTGRDTQWFSGVLDRPILDAM